MHVLVLAVDLHLAECRSLKTKRSVLRPIVEGVRRRFNVACAEVDHQDSWQRARLGVAVVSGSAHHATDVIDEVERFVWSFPDVAVLSTERTWLDPDT